MRTPVKDAELRKYEYFLHNWECMYSPERITDGNPATAWCEGVPDEGINQVVIAHVDVLRPVRIWTGFGISKALFAANCRPRKIAVMVLVAEETSPHQDGTAYVNIKIVAQHEVELKDLNGYQSLPIPENNITDEKRHLTFLAIKILTVYHGTKYKDTLISEISN